MAAAMTDEPIQTALVQVGDFQVSDSSGMLKNCVIFFAFPKSRSANFPIAQALAQAASAYGEQAIGGRVLYWAGFTKSPSDLERASELLRLAGGWVGTIARINGHNISDKFNAHLTLSCYQRALQCANPSAHCHEEIEDPFHPNYDALYKKVKENTGGFLDRRAALLETEEVVKKFIFPCKRMLETSLFHPQFSGKQLADVPARDLIQAAAVECGTNICPFFDVSAFREVGFGKVKVQVLLTDE